MQENSPRLPTVNEPAEVTLLASLLCNNVYKN